MSNLISLLIKLRKLVYHLSLSLSSMYVGQHLFMQHWFWRKIPMLLNSKLGNFASTTKWWSSISKFIEIKSNLMSNLISLFIKLRKLVYHLSLSLSLSSMYVRKHLFMQHWFWLKIPMLVNSKLGNFASITKWWLSISKFIEIKSNLMTNLISLFIKLRKLVYQQPW